MFTPATSPVYLVDHSVLRVLVEALDTIASFGYLSHTSVNVLNHATSARRSVKDYLNAKDLPALRHCAILQE
ncbi:hypothetical protein B0H67DRAFT_572545 [Lasiosphaeris hirsuta]|uniref:Uncharacterized protein n=1 Tax=Lasiosphaeris hirsuta TaxID=260670 RepID=A0AA40DXE5_9PEZI|nr:hypothetical protein B0H67DRAFT_572545 [Lasiosphaeris hirsuta]